MAVQRAATLIFQMLGLKTGRELFLSFLYLQTVRNFVSFEWDYCFKKAHEKKHLGQAVQVEIIMKHATKTYQDK